MYLIDTNIFLEILLNQSKKEICKNFIESHSELYISDFSFHSIGLILFYRDMEKVFLMFTEDILDKFDILTLDREDVPCLVDYKVNLKLDFDDVYQYCVAKKYGLSIVTLDKDFEKVKDVNVIFL